MGETRFYVLDPGMGGDCIVGSFESLDEAMSCASDIIAEYRRYCDPEWSEEVDDVAVYEAPVGTADIDEVGKLVAKAVEFNRVDRPDDVDEDGYSESTGLSFFSVDYYTDYRMELRPCYTEG